MSLAQNKLHPALWESDWIEANAHKYDNPVPAEEIKKNIIIRLSFDKTARGSEHYGDLDYGSDFKRATGNLAAAKIATVRDKKREQFGSLIATPKPAEMVAVAEFSGTVLRKWLIEHGIDITMPVNKLILDILDKEVSPEATYFQESPGTHAVCVLFAVGTVEILYNITFSR